MNNKVIWIINQYATTPSTGAGGRHYYLAEELAKKGYKVYLVMAGFTHSLRTPPILFNKFQIEHENGINIVWIKMPKYKNGHSKKRVLNWFLFSFKLRKLDHKIPDKPDVILYSSLSLIGFLSAKYLAKKLKVRLVFEVRDIWPMSLIELGKYSTKHPFVIFLQWIEDKAYRESDMVISNLKYAVEHMVSRGMPRDKFRWVPNGFSLSEVSVQEKLDSNTVEKIPKNKFIIGYTGAIGAANELNSLVDAALLLDKSYPDIYFIIVGEGKYKDALQKKVSNNKLQNIAFIDSIPKGQVQAILGLFDVCYIGIKNSPLFKFGVSPNKLFDYLYAAKPTIYAIDSGEYNPIRDYKAGIQVEPENSSQIRDAILELYNMNPQDIKELGDNAREAALKYHEYSQLADKLESVLFSE